MIIPACSASLLLFLFRLLGLFRLRSFFTLLLGRFFLLLTKNAIVTFREVLGFGQTHTNDAHGFRNGLPRGRPPPETGNSSAILTQTNGPLPAACRLSFDS